MQNIVYFSRADFEAFIETGWWPTSAASAAEATFVYNANDLYFVTDEDVSDVKINGTSIKNANGEVLLATVAQSGSYNDLTNKPTIPVVNYPVTDVQVNGTSIVSSKVANIDLSGKQATIDATHKLSADLVDDSNSTNKFVTSSEKTTWSGKSTVSASSSGTSTDTISYITIDGAEKKIASPVANEISYTTTAPSADNTSGNLKFVVLSSEPAQRYSGYFYIITSSN